MDKEHKEFHNGERMTNNYKVTEIDSLGYGNPEAKISYKKKIDSGEFQPEVIEKGVEVIKSGECMVDVTDPDDGCIDGRLTTHVLAPTMAGESFVDTETVDANHNRNKVAGGGYITSLVMKLALDPEVESLDEDLSEVARHLTEQGIYCGTHTGEHVHDDKNVDCGANDKFEQILRRGAGFMSEIGDTIRSITTQFDLGVKFDDDVIDQANAGLEGTLGHADYFAGSNGKSRFKIIMENIAEVQKKANTDRAVSVSKHLGGDHNEAFIVLNTVKGKTFSQAEFHKRLVEAFPGVDEKQIPQAFIVDVPRIVELAQKMVNGRDNEEQAFMVALYAGLAFQFAAAAELTDGTLRRFVVQ